MSSDFRSISNVNFDFMDILRN